MPEFIPLGKEPEVIAAAKTIADVLWDDLAFEKEFYLLPRDILRTVPRPASAEQVAIDRWKELGAEGWSSARCARPPTASSSKPA